MYLRKGIDVPATTKITIAATYILKGQKKENSVFVCVSLRTYCKLRVKCLKSTIPLRKVVTSSVYK